MTDARSPSSTSEPGRVLSPEQTDYDLSCYLVADLESRLEGAHMSGDQALRTHLYDLYHRAIGMKSRCWGRLRATLITVAFQIGDDQEQYSRDVPVVPRVGEDIEFDGSDFTVQAVIHVIDEGVVVVRAR